jgi:hypothetical protein
MLMNNLIKVFALSLVLLLCSGCDNSPSVNKWQNLQHHAKNGSMIRLTVMNASTPDNKSIYVFLVHNGIEDDLAAFSFYVQTPCNFMCDMSSTLRKIPYRLGDDTKIVIRGEDGVNVKYSSLNGRRKPLHRRCQLVYSPS